MEMKNYLSHLEQEALNKIKNDKKIIQLSDKASK
jgi:hypothetical protein